MHNFFFNNSRYYSNEVGGYSSPYGGYSQSVTTPQNIGYDISADYVDSTTTYEPRSTIIDSDFIGGHSKFEMSQNIFDFLIDIMKEIKRQTNNIEVRMMFHTAHIVFVSEFGLSTFQRFLLSLIYTYT